jgi:hypothetical protein
MKLENFIEVHSENKISTFIFVLVDTISASLFSFYWIGVNRKNLRNYFGTELISNNLFYFLIILSGIDIWLLAFEDDLTDPYNVWIITIVVFILFRVIAFSIANEFKIQFIKEKIKLPEEVNFNLFFTILFGFYYINYKLNQLCDLEVVKKK